MKNRFVAGFLCVVVLSVEVFADDVIKRTTYPYMAFIYYQDESVEDLSGGRFLQGAVLIGPSFLISSSLESTISHDPLSKTLLARLGATVIDTKFSLNEDEDEQEQEIIQITRPYEHNSTQWWVTDITILKALQPFESTKAVHITQLFKKDDAEDKICHILVFQKRSNTDIRILTRLDVEMLPPSAENCGEKFVDKYMACATEATNEEQLSNDFCHGNSGGPLVCDDDNVMALQTYINGNCNAPHLYQLLAPRKRFLYCGMDEKCGNGECQDVCSVTLKDPPSTTNVSETTTTTTTTLAETTSAVQTNEPPAPVEPITPSEPTSLFSESTAPTITTLSTSQNTTWPLEKEPRKANDDEDSENLRPVQMAAQEATNKRHHSHGSSGANNNMVVLHSFVYSGFLLCICLM